MPVRHAEMNHEDTLISHTHYKLSSEKRILPYKQFKLNIFKNSQQQN